MAKKKQSTKGPVQKVAGDKPPQATPAFVASPAPEGIDLGSQLGLTAMNARIPVETMRLLKVTSAQEGRKMHDIVNAALLTYLSALITERSKGKAKK